MKQKTMIVCSLGLVMALSSCATKHAQPNGTAAQGNVSAVRTCQAPASIVGKTLHIDARQASYKFMLDVPAEEYADWHQNARRYVSETNSYDYTFLAEGKLKGYPDDCTYLYHVQGEKGLIVARPGEGTVRIELVFETPASGTAHMIEDGAIGSEYGNTITFSNMPFTLK